MPDFSVALNRKFFPAAEDVAESDGDPSYADYFGLTKPIYWEQLWQKPRVVILAEAGAGKTYELENATKTLRRQGKPAFFIRLEHLKDGSQLVLRRKLALFGLFQNLRITTGGGIGAHAGGGGLEAAFFNR